MAKGKPTYYPGKKQQAITVNFTPTARAELKHCTDEIGASGSDLQEHAWRKLRGLEVNAELETLIAGVARAAVPV